MSQSYKKLELAHLDRHGTVPGSSATAGKFSLILIYPSLLSNTKMTTLPTLCSMENLECTDRLKVCDVTKPWELFTLRLRRFISLTSKRPFDCLKCNLHVSSLKIKDSRCYYKRGNCKFIFSTLECQKSGSFHIQ